MNFSGGEGNVLLGSTGSGTRRGRTWIVVFVGGCMAGALLASVAVSFRSSATTTQGEASASGRLVRIALNAGHVAGCWVIASDNAIRLSVSRVLFRACIPSKSSCAQRIFLLLRACVTLAYAGFVVIFMWRVYVTTSHMHAMVRIQPRSVYSTCITVLLRTMKCGCLD